MEPFQILMRIGHLDQKMMQNPYMNVAEDEKQSRAPREPNLTKSEPFQIQVKLDLLDQKIMQNPYMKSIEDEKLIQSS